MRYLGLDLGTKTLGIAISDKTNNIASPLTTLRFNNEDYESLIEPLKDIISENNITKIVLGLPVNMDQTPSERSELCLEFKEKIERRTGIPVEMLDERLTTVEADAIMDEVGIKGRERKEYVDMIAAQIILQDYLDNKK